MRRGLLMSVAACGAMCAGCGATPPQAPLPAAKKLDTSLSAISTACGLAYQTSAFAGPAGGDLAPLERSATAAADKLASVRAMNGSWIYQGETVQRITSEATRMLRECGLTSAARELESRVRAAAG